MLKKVSAMKARQNLGQVMNEVSLKGDDVIVERAGKPLVAIISIEKYRMIGENMETARAELETIWGKMNGERTAGIERTVDEAVRSSRDR